MLNLTEGIFISTTVAFDRRWILKLAFSTRLYSHTEGTAE